jgi:homotetrameric cytidine deaminase
VKALLEAARAAKLLEAARAAKAHAYAPKSGFPVGAAVRVEGGRIFSGCNIEVGMNELGLCAERTALYKAISEGFLRIEAAAVVTNGREAVTPCGVCREALYKFASSPSMPVYLARASDLSRPSGRTVRLSIRALLPHTRSRSRMAESKSHRKR